MGGEECLSLVIPRPLLRNLALTPSCKFKVDKLLAHSWTSRMASGEHFPLELWTAQIHNLSNLWNEVPVGPFVHLTPIPYDGSFGNPGPHTSKSLDWIRGGAWPWQRRVSADKSLSFHWRVSWTVHPCVYHTILKGPFFLQAVQPQIYINLPQYVHSSNTCSPTFHLFQWPTT